MIGQTLGHYRIESKLGQGGMGEVYRAKDTKLGRDVAIKVLPPAFAEDPERLARFEREAHVLASLNHPNIAAIYGFEQAGGVPFLVLEYVPGEILKGPMPVEDALGVCRQMAEALQEAHEKGFMHRDLKPANIKITPEGKVKVLDFGLAKALADEPAQGDGRNSPTLSILATRAGTLLGTAAYMSPEQARGRPIDKRADIWAFGCVLYEMLVGKQTFSGGSITDVLAAVVRAEPDWSALPAGAPLRLLHRCLEKDPARRLRDIGDARFDLEADAVSPAAGPGVRASRLPWVAAAVMTLVAAVGVWAPWRAQRAAAPVVRAAVTPPPGDRLAVNPLQGSIALSPDGSRLVYAAVRGGRAQLFLRRLDQFDAAPITGAEDGAGPFFSPDGEWVGFFAGGKLKRVQLSGGAPQTVCEAPAGRGATWAPDDTIILTPNNPAGTGLAHVPAGGGVPQALTTPDNKSNEHSHRWPQILPGGKAVLFTVFTGGNPDENSVAVLRLDTGERRTLVEGATDGRYIPTGHLVYSRSGSLLAAPFDVSRLAVTGRQVPVLEGVRTAASTGFVHYCFSSTGSLLYLSGGLESLDLALVWVDHKGKATPATDQRRYFLHPRLSPDGRRIAVTAGGGAGADIWVLDLSRDVLARLTFEPGQEGASLWTPDGKRVVFGAVRSGAAQNLYWKAADGSGPEERLTTSPHLQTPGSFSRDGKWLAFREVNPASSDDIWLLPMEGDRKPKPFLQTPFSEAEPAFSPDGRWLAYSSSESGSREVYVQPFPGPGGKWQVSTNGGRMPVWSPNGRELFYRNGDQTMAVEVGTGGAFSAGKPRLLFEGQYFSLPGATHYDVAPDGKRFLMLKNVTPEAALTQINLVENWFEELKQRAK